MRALFFSFPHRRISGRILLWKSLWITFHEIRSNALFWAFLPFLLHQKLWHNNWWGCLAFARGLTTQPYILQGFTRSSGHPNLWWTMRHLLPWFEVRHPGFGSQSSRLRKLGQDRPLHREKRRIPDKLPNRPCGKLKLAIEKNAVDSIKRGRFFIFKGSWVVSGRLHKIGHFDRRRGKEFFPRSGQFFIIFCALRENEQGFLPLPVLCRKWAVAVSWLAQSSGTRAENPGASYTVA